MIKVNYVIGSPVPARSGYGKYSLNVLRELQKIRGLQLRELVVDLPLHFPYKSVLLNFSATPLKALLHRKHAVTHATSQGLAFLSSLRLHPFVVTAYDAIAFALPEEKQSIAKRLLLNLMLKGLRRADALITISDFSRRELARYACIPLHKISVAYPAVDHKIFKPVTATKPSLSTVLYVGSEQPRKNLGVLLQAFAKARRKLPKLKLVKVGAPQWHNGRQAFLAKAKELGVEKNIEFVDAITEQELANIYRSAGVLVFPSTYEGFGLPPLEAMACGTPVICSNAASIPEVVGDAAVSLAPNNVNGFADAIIAVLTNKKLRSRLRSAGLRQAKKFTWRAAAEKTLEVYKSIS